METTLLDRFEPSSRNFRIGLRHTAWANTIFDLNYHSLQQLLETEKETMLKIPEPTMNVYNGPRDRNPRDDPHFDSVAEVLPGTRLAIQLAAGAVYVHVNTCHESSHGRLPVLNTYCQFRGVRVHVRSLGSFILTPLQLVKFRQLG